VSGLTTLDRIRWAIAGDEEKREKKKRGMEISPLDFLFTFSSEGERPGKKDENSL